MLADTQVNLAHFGSMQKGIETGSSSLLPPQQE